MKSKSTRKQVNNDEHNRKTTFSQSLKTKASQHRCLLASGELPVRRADLPVRKSTAQGAIAAIACQAKGAWQLGDNAGAKFYLRPFESCDSAVRTKHDLKLREHFDYIRQYGLDMSEVRDWMWSENPKSSSEL